MTTKPYTIVELANMWEREQITAEQLMGQILVHINLLQQQLIQLRSGVPLSTQTNPAAQRSSQSSTGTPPSANNAAR